VWIVASHFVDFMLCSTIFIIIHICHFCFLNTLFSFHTFTVNCFAVSDQLDVSCITQFDSDTVFIAYDSELSDIVLSCCKSTWYIYFCIIMMKIGLLGNCFIVQISLTLAIGLSFMNEL